MYGVKCFVAISIISNGINGSVDEESIPVRISKIEINAMITSLADLHQINPHPMVLLLEIPAPSHLPSPTLLVMSKWSYDCELAFFVVLAVKAKKCAFCKFRNFKLSNERALMKNRTLVKTEKTIPSSITNHHSPYCTYRVIIDGIKHQRTRSNVQYHQIINKERVLTRTQLIISIVHTLKSIGTLHYLL